MPKILFYFLTKAQTNHFLLGLMLLLTATGAVTSLGNFTGMAVPYPTDYAEKTAANENYDPALYTFAGRNFSKNDWVKVTNQDNGQVAYARQNDLLRAPESYTFIAKLSKAVALDLGMTSAATVTVEKVEKSQVPERFLGRRITLDGGQKKNTTPHEEKIPGQLPPTPKPSDPITVKQFEIDGTPIYLSSQYGVQLISLSSHESAFHFTERPEVKALGTTYFEPYFQPGNDKLFYRVLVGSFATPEEAEKAAQKFRAAGYTDCKARVYE
jgi:rare lipoprotein A (peptidoglycan hydrolase)